jgi:hypothetical protein
MHICCTTQKKLSKILIMSLIREIVLATIMYKKVAILVYMLLRAVPFLSSIFLDRLSDIGTLRFWCFLFLLPFDLVFFSISDEEVIHKFLFLIIIIIIKGKKWLVLQQIIASLVTNDRYLPRKIYSKEYEIIVTIGVHQKW